MGWVFICVYCIHISLEEQYPDVQEKSPETWRALLRRIHEVQIYQKDGTIVTYNSVEEYMKRKNEFHPCRMILQFHLMKFRKEIDTYG